MTELRVIEDAADLLQFAELTDIRVYEVSGIRTSDDVPGAPKAKSDAPTETEDFQVQARGDLTWMEVRTRLQVKTSDAQMIANIGAIYSFSQPVTIPPQAAAEFVQRVGIMAVYPFIREQIFSSARRLGVSPPVLGLLRAGSFEVAPPLATDENVEIEATTPPPQRPVRKKK